MWSHCMGCEQSHFIGRFDSFVMAKMSIKGGIRSVGKGVRDAVERLEEFLENGSAMFLCDEKLGESILL